MSGFRVALLAFRFVVVLGAGACDSALAAEGIEVCIVTDHTGVSGHDAGGVEKVFSGELSGTASWEQGHALASDIKFLFNNGAGKEIVARKGKGGITFTHGARLGPRLFPWIWMDLRGEVGDGEGAVGDAKGCAATDGALEKSRR